MDPCLHALSAIHFLYATTMGRAAQKMSLLCLLASKISLKYPSLPPLFEGQGFDDKSATAEKNHHNRSNSITYKIKYIFPYF